MRRTPLILPLAAALCISGCAARDNQAAIEKLARQVADLKSSFSETDSRVEELGSKLSLLHEKVEARGASGGPSGAEEAAGAQGLRPSLPPEGLKVVRLGEDLEEGAPGPSVGTDNAHRKGLSAASAPKEGPESLYGRGQDLFISGQYGEAIKAFLSLAAAYPAHPLADNALYWAGESYYSEKDYANALASFKEAAERYPHENKAPDALLKAAFSHIEMNDKEKGISVIEDLIRRYPGSEAAAKAKKTLEKLSGPKKDG